MPTGSATSPDADASLICAAKDGDRQALDALVVRYDRWVRSIVYAVLGSSALVDDIVQHVWTNVWRQIGTLVDVHAWRGWLSRMARNAAIDAGEKHTRERRQRLSLAGVEEPAARHDSPEHALIRSEEHRRVMEAIQGLPPIYREPFVLRHVDDMSYAQIAEVLDMPVDTVETRLVRARRLLRQALGGPENRRAEKVKKR